MAGASQITLVSDEPAYSRMVLPYYLANQIPQQQVYIADDAYFETLKVQRLIGTRVTRVDPNAKTVTLEDGQTLSFDNLLIATGFFGGHSANSRRQSARRLSAVDLGAHGGGSSTCQGQAEAGSGFHRRGVHRLYRAQRHAQAWLEAAGGGNRQPRLARACSIPKALA